MSKSFLLKLIILDLILTTSFMIKTGNAPEPIAGSQILIFSKKKINLNIKLFKIFEDNNPILKLGIFLSLSNWISFFQYSFDLPLMSKDEIHYNYMGL